MNYSVVMAGFGGQGVLLMGDFLAFCGMKSGFNVTWMPSYGVEMRGGAANCTVVLSDEAIGAPIVGSPRALIALSEPALDKFKGRLTSRSLLLANSSLIPGDRRAEVEGESVFIPAIELAAKTGNTKMVNVIMLGAFLAHTGLLKLEEVKKQVEPFLSPAKKSLTPGVLHALELGEEFIESL